MFEVRELPDKKLRVYATLRRAVARADAQRDAADARRDPAAHAVALPGCSSDQPGFPCTIEEFAVACATRSTATAWTEASGGTR